jgi:hypothetical protein
MGHVEYRIWNAVAGWFLEKDMIVSRKLRNPRIETISDFVIFLLLVSYILEVLKVL